MLQMEDLETELISNHLPKKLQGIEETHIVSLSTPINPNTAFSSVGITNVRELHKHLLTSTMALCGNCSKVDHILRQWIPILKSFIVFWFKSYHSSWLTSESRQIINYKIYAAIDTTRDATWIWRNSIHHSSISK